MRLASISSLLILSSPSVSMRTIRFGPTSLYVSDAHRCSKVTTAASEALDMRTSSTATSIGRANIPSRSASHWARS